jgi:hypothetical protein
MKRFPLVILPSQTVRTIPKSSRDAEEGAIRFGDELKTG